MDPAILVRPAAELTIKGHRARKTFALALERNLGAALSRLGIEHQLEARFGRLFVATEARQVALAAVARVFGVGSASPIAATVPAEVPAIVAAGVAAFADAVAGKRFAVRCKRQGEHAFRSQELAGELGAALLAASRERGARVDLSRPEITVEVEVLGARAHLFARRVPGPGGLPGAVQGRALALISGGFDSPVASWRIARRGIAVDWLFCNLGGAAAERMVLGVCKVLAEKWWHGQQPILHVVDFGPLVADLRARIGSGYWQIALKLLMIRAACLVAAEIGGEGIVTGESLGQVSSQTLANLRALDAAAATGLPMLRPLVGCDKLEIIAEARRIGTAHLSERVREVCALGSPQPVIAARPHKLASALQNLDGALLSAAVAERKRIDVLAATAADLREPYLFTRQIPHGAVLIDCRPPPERRGAEVAGALARDPDELLSALGSLDKERAYLLYCAQGSVAANLAAAMQQAGFEAYAFEGGPRELLQTLAAQSSPLPASPEGRR